MSGSALLFEYVAFFTFSSLLTCCAVTGAHCHLYIYITNLNIPERTLDGRLFSKLANGFLTCLSWPTTGAYRHFVVKFEFYVPNGSSYFSRKPSLVELPSMSLFIMELRRLFAYTSISFTKGFSLLYVERLLPF